MLMAGSSAALACDCMQLDVARRLQLSDLVFVGETVAFAPLSKARFRVIEFFKGAPSAEVRVTISASDCEYFLPPVEPRIGQRFVVFGTATASPGVVTASRCLGSGLLSEKSIDLQQLRDLARSTARMAERLPEGETPVPALPRMQARVRIMSPQLGPGWRTGMLNGTRPAPPCYLVLLFHPGRTRQIAATVYLGAITRLQVSSLYAGEGAADPDPASGSYNGEQWREGLLDSARAQNAHCPATIDRDR